MEHLILLKKGGNIKMARLNDQFVDMTSGKKVELKRKLNSFDEGIIYVLLDQQGNEIRESELTCFRFVGNDTPLPKMDPDDIVIKNGKLFIGEAEVQCGELYIEELLQLAEEYLLLSVQAKNKENGSELFRYNISDDKFLKLSQNSEKENRKVTYGRIYGRVDDDFVCIKERTVVSTEYSVETEGATETKSASKQTEAAFFYEKCFYYANVYESLPGTSEIKRFTSCDNKDILLFSFISSNKQVEGYDDIFETVPREDGKALYLELAIEYEYDEEEEKEKLNFSVDMLRNILFSDDILLTHDGRNSILIIGDDAIVYSNNGYSPRMAKGKDIVNVVKTYPSFVTLEPGTHHNTFVFANKNYETVRISVTKTDDRGFTTSIE